MKNEDYSKHGDQGIELGIPGGQTHWKIRFLKNCGYTVIVYRSNIVLKYD